MIHKLIPACKDYLWGGTRLKDEYAKQSDAAIVAESWELSCHPDGPSRLEGSDMTLPEYLRANPAAAGALCAAGKEFPMLIKLIDAAQNLSVQVHPDDAYAKEHEGQQGKTEMWYIVDAKEGAGIYYGLKSAVCAQEFAQAIAENRVCDLLQWVPVKKGDCFFIEAGTIHAIGAGCLIAEVQQSSNVTYRVYDYGRVDANGKPRDLHVEKACAVSKLAPANAPQMQGHLADCAYFTADLLDVAGECKQHCGTESFQHLLVLSGTVTIACAGKNIAAKKGDSLFVQAGTGEYTLTGTAQVLQSYLRPQQYKIGIDLGGTNIKAGVLDSANNLLATHKCPTTVQRPWQEVAADMAEAVKKAAEKASVSLDACVSVGVGSPGIVDEATGVVVYSNNFPGWENIPLAKALEETLKLPVKISNDANCAALGEFVAGAAKGSKSTVLLTLGTGVGGGIVFDSKVFSGGGAGGAELGHVTLHSGGEECTCGRKGCIEAYCSATALVREACRAMAQHPESALFALCEGKAEQMNGRIPFLAAEQGDAVAEEVVRMYLQHLGEAIVNMVNIFRPEVVLLSGGICGEGEALTRPLDAYITQYAFGGARVAVPPVRCATLGNDAGIVGAANLT